MPGKLACLARELQREFQRQLTKPPHRYNDAPSRALIDSGDSPDARLRIVIPAMRDWLHLPFFALWLLPWLGVVIVWTVSLVGTALRDITGSSVPLGSSTMDLRLQFLMFPILLLFGLPMVRLFSWVYFGREVITLHREEFCYEQYVGRFRIKQWRINHKQIDRFCAASEGKINVWLASFYTLFPPNRYISCIAVAQTLGQDRFFGKDLNQTEGKNIVALLNQRREQFSRSTTPSIAVVAVTAAPQTTVATARA